MNWLVKQSRKKVPLHPRYKIKWRFPEIGVAPVIILIFVGFSSIHQPFWGTSMTTESPAVFDASLPAGASNVWVSQRTLRHRMGRHWWNWPSHLPRTKTEGGAPPVMWTLVYNPNNYRYNPPNQPKREIVLINQLNANELGHHLVDNMPEFWCFLFTPFYYLANHHWVGWPLFV